MPWFNFDPQDGKPPVGFSLKADDAERFMTFMAECQELKERRPETPNACLRNEKGTNLLPKQHSEDWKLAIQHAVSRIEATIVVPGQTPEQLRDGIALRVKGIAAPTYVVNP